MTVLGEDLVLGEWADRAACRGQNPDLFHPERDADLAPALAFCEACPVRADCLAYAIEHGCLGVWGGTSERQRRTVRRTARIRYQAPPPGERAMRDLDDGTRSARDIADAAGLTPRTVTRARARRRKDQP